MRRFRLRMSAELLAQLEEDDEPLFRLLQIAAVGFEAGQLTDPASRNG
jgi:hypothetical protein